MLSKINGYSDPKKIKIGPFFWASVVLFYDIRYTSKPKLSNSFQVQKNVKKNIYLV